MSSGKGKQEYSLVPGFDITLLERRKLDEEDKSRINLKAITSPSDILIDIPSFGGVDPSEMTYSEKFKVRERHFAGLGKKVPGLVIVYPIDKDSGKFDTPRSDDGKSHRVALNAAADVYGICFVFPIVKIGDYDSVCIELPNVLAVEKEDYAEE